MYFFFRNSVIVTFVLETAISINQNVSTRRRRVSYSPDLMSDWPNLQKLRATPSPLVFGRGDGEAEFPFAARRISLFVGVIGRLEDAGRGENVGIASLISGHFFRMFPYVPVRGS